ncbi:MAG: CbiX/SirB N-terminal domain-containing protein, partial [Burkholderiaceae bacterium]|nr:CbiX/SirB N-terminal domain-containing protein [Burkholderiaceae bacterium]
MTTGHILLAHGSRDPEWPAAIDAVAARIRQLNPATPVRCAYLEHTQPDLASALDALLAQRALTILIWPMFLGLGRHARDDLPRLIAGEQERIHARRPDITLALQPAIAEDDRVLDAIARVILHKPSNF